MSMQALFLITDEQTIIDACNGWMPPLEKERKKKHENPFTGEITTVSTLVPKELEDSLDELEDPTIEEIEAGPLFEAYDKLSGAEPVSVEFTLPRGLYEVIGKSPPFLFGAVEGEIQEITLVSPEHEAELLENLSDLAGSWVDERKRRENKLSIFIYIYS